MIGSVPVFYKIPVSRKLVEAVIRGQTLLDAHVVEKFIPVIINKKTYSTGDMKPLRNRL
jgi:hypothetical protein